MVYALDPASGMRRLHADVAPGLRARLESWESAREDRARLPQSLEHRLVSENRAQLAWREGDAAWSGALASESALALALVPIRDAHGEVAGWLHVECEHALLPTRGRLRAAADSWGARLQGAQPRASAGAQAPLYGAPSCEAAVLGSSQLPPLMIQLAQDEPREAREASFQALASGLGMKTSQRRWWGFEVRGEEALLVAEGGGALEDWHRVPGGARSLLRALRVGSAVRFEEPDPDLGMHAESSSGMCIALHASGRQGSGELPCALFAVESNRRRDFQLADLERLRERAGRGARALWLGQFRDWHVEHFGQDVGFDADAAYLRAHFEDLLSAGRSQAPVLLHGPRGAGKGTLARLLHYAWIARAGAEAPPHARRAPLRVQPCAPFEAAELERRLFGPSGSWEAARGGGLVLEGVDALPPALAHELAERLGSEAERAPRVLALLDTESRRPRAGGVLEQFFAGPLGAVFERLHLGVPALSARRDEILGLAELLLERCAAEEDQRRAHLTSEARATLWRQPWKGGLRELEAFLYKLALLHPGEELNQARLADVAQRFGLRLLHRLPSRRPPKDLIRQALDSTRKSNGRINKTRAARALGWDPDTLVLRMRDHNLPCD